VQGENKEWKPAARETKTLEKSHSHDVVVHSAKWSYAKKAKVEQLDQLMVYTWHVHHWPPRDISAIVIDYLHEQGNE
jgi:hypothetical protein